MVTGVPTFNRTTPTPLTFGDLSPYQQRASTFKPGVYPPRNHFILAVRVSCIVLLSFSESAACSVLTPLGSIEEEIQTSLPSDELFVSFSQNKSIFCLIWTKILYSYGRRKTRPHWTILELEKFFFFCNSVWIYFLKDFFSKTKTKGKWLWREEKVWTQPDSTNWNVEECGTANQVMVDGRKLQAAEEKDSGKFSWYLFIRFIFRVICFPGCWTSVCFVSDSPTWECRPPQFP